MSIPPYMKQKPDTTTVFASCLTCGKDKILYVPLQDWYAYCNPHGPGEMVHEFQSMPEEERNWLIHSLCPTHAKSREKG